MSETKHKIELTDFFKYQELMFCGNKYLVGVCKKKESRQISITNLIEYYEENLLKEDIIKRCQDLNPILISSNFEEIVDNILVDIPKYVVSSTLGSIQLETKIEGGRFQFNIILTKCSSEYFDNFFKENLLCSFSELYHRYRYLLNIVNKKDQEINEYKAQGIELIRKTTVTEPFVENLFYTELNNVRSLDKITTFLDIMNFYNSIKDLYLENINKESIVMESISHVDNKLQTNSNDGKTIVKSQASSDFRCAVASKIEKKAKICKQSSEFKFL